MKKVPVGVDNFAKLIKGDYLFCDKTLMIKDLLNKGDEVTLITRPRRWGKSLNMSMLQHFFSPKVGLEETKDLFKELNIAKIEQGNYLQYQGQNPVIFVSFKDVRESTFEQTIRQFSALIKNLYREHQYLLDSTQLSTKDKEQFNKLAL